MNATIRFTKLNRYRRAIGSLDTEMGYGVQSALVQRGIAEWVTETPVLAASISEPFALAPVVPTNSTPVREHNHEHRSRRRDHNNKES